MSLKTTFVLIEHTHIKGRVSLLTECPSLANSPVQASSLISTVSRVTSMHTVGTKSRDWKLVRFAGVRVNVENTRRAVNWLVKFACQQLRIYLWNRHNRKSQHTWRWPGRTFRDPYDVSTVAGLLRRR